MVRSCYHGTWRLFQDSSILTQGRYYFADTDTPYYPDWHQYGSADWTYQGNEAYIPPDLGEDKLLRLGYSKGNLGVTQPQPIILGSESCIEEGEAISPPPDTENRVLIAGIPSGCWTGSVPDPIPVLWLLPEALPAVPPGGKIARWRDASVMENDAVQPDPDFQPVRNNDFPNACAMSVANQTLSLLRPISLQYRYTLFSVFVGSNLIFNPFSRADWWQAQFRWHLRQWRHPFSGGQWIWNWPLPNAAGGFGIIVREGSEWRLQRGLQTSAPFDTQLQIPVGFQSILPIVTGSLGPSVSFCFELKVYDGILTPAQMAAEIAWFTARYGL